MRAWQQVAPEYAGLKHVIFGRSLGTGLATHLAMQVHSDMLILVSPYRSIEAIATSLYPWVPPFVLRYPLHTDEWLPEVTGRIAIFHGDRDTLIPFSHAVALQHLKPNAQLVRVAGAGHGDVQNFSAYTQSLTQLLAQP